MGSVKNGGAQASPAVDKEQYVNEHHKYKIEKWSNDRWSTRVKTEHGRRLVSRLNRDDLICYLYDFYTGNIQKPSVDDIDTVDYKSDFSLYKEIYVWDIKEATYLISPIGDVYSTLIKDWLKPQIKDKTKTYPGNKYVFLLLKDGEAKWFSVPRLICATFNGLPSESIEHPSVDHIDGNPRNNYYTNLRWIEHYQNSSIRHNRGIGEMNSRAILTEEDVVDICNKLVKKQESVPSLAIQYGVSEGAITNIKEHKTWNYISRWFQF